MEGQYIFKFSITHGDVKKDDFITEDGLKTFTMIEEAGNVLPTFELAFRTSDPSILPYLNEGNVLDISFGRSYRDEDLIDAKFSILRMNYNKSGEANYSIYIAGVFAVLKYLSEDVVAQYANMSGIEAIKQVADQYLSTDFNVKTSQDSQTWLRPNTPAKAFINQTWMHSYIKDSFIGIGIDSSGTLILKDMKLAVKTYAETPQFNFTTDPKLISNTDILYDGDYIVDSNSGFMNYFTGYGREKHLYNFETGVDTDVLEDPDILMTPAKAFVRSSEITKKADEVSFQNENVHENFWTAYQSNLQNLTLFSTNKISLSFHQLYKPIKVLDVVGFSDIELNAHFQEKAGTSAGRYFVSKVARTVSNRTFVTTLQLCRESLSEIQGDLR